MKTPIKTKIGTSVIHKKTGKTMYLYDCRSQYDIDVLFDDGIITTHKRWSNFKQGKIKYQKDKKINMNKAMQVMKQRTETFEKESDSIKRLYEESISKAGQKMKIIRYGDSSDIDIEFEDGVIVYHKRYDAFKTGSIRNPRLHIGEKNIANNGMSMEITEYHDARNVTIKFADGTIVKNQSYECFKNRMIVNPNMDSTITEKLRKERTNTTCTKKDGTVITCIEYIDSENVTVQFPDGTIRKNISWGDFTKGHVGLAKKATNKDHINETNTNKNGLKMTIIDHNPSENPIVEFEDGYITQKIDYTNFKKGYGAHKSLKTTRNRVKGALYNTQIKNIAHNANYTTHYTCYCPICNTSAIWTFDQIKKHPCNLTHPDQELLKTVPKELKT